MRYSTKLFFFWKYYDLVLVYILFFVLCELGFELNYIPSGCSLFIKSLLKQFSFSFWVALETQTPGGHINITLVLCSLFGFSTDITLLTKVHIAKTMIFPVGWTIKQSECQRIDAFELWCWRLLRVLWAARRSNQSILKQINAEYSLEELAEVEAPVLWPPNVKNQLIGKDPDAGKNWGQEKEGKNRRWVGWMAPLT